MGGNLTATGRDEMADAADHDRSGRDVEESILRAEEGTRDQGRHTLDESASEPGESRIERTAEVEEITEGRGGAQEPARGPGPQDVGSGGAQRIVGARISDRVSAGEPVPDGPPFEDER
jgi:hypothetical protein